MKTQMKIIAVLFAIAAFAAVFYQITSEESIKKVPLRDCINGKVGLFNVYVDYENVTYKGGSKISAGFITRKMKPESVLTLKHKGFFNEIVSFE